MKRVRKYERVQIELNEIEIANCIEALNYIVADSNKPEGIKEVMKSVSMKLNRQFIYNK